MKEKTTARYDEAVPAVTVSSGNGPFTTEVDGYRRRFLKHSALALAFASAAGMIVGKSAWAGRTGRLESDDSPELLDPEDPQAKALSYTPSSHKTKQQCSNCQLFTGTDGEALGPCAIFSYRVSPAGKQLQVDAGGWCRAWAPRQDV